MTLERPISSDPRPVDLSVVIVSYNTRDLTLECVHSIYAETREIRFDVTVVDNASADDSVAEIVRQFPQVRMLPLTDNYGYGRAVNHGAQTGTGRYVLVLNPDTRMLPGALDRLVRLADARPQHRIYGGLTLNDDGSANPSSCWRRPTPWSVFCQAAGLSTLLPRSRLFCPQTVALDPGREAQRVDIVSGGFLLVERALWSQLGGFDPAFFFYGEDFDLCLRAHESGADPVVFPSVRIVHHGGRSPLASAERFTRLFSAQVRVFRRHWGPAANVAGRSGLLLWALVRRLGFRLAGRPDQARIWDEVWRRRREFLASGRVPTALSPIRERPLAES